MMLRFDAPRITSSLRGAPASRVARMRHWNARDAAHRTARAPLAGSRTASSHSHRMGMVAVARAMPLVWRAYHPSWAAGMRARVPDGSDAANISGVRAELVDAGVLGRCTG